jgi:hypothetical protein
MFRKPRGSKWAVVLVAVLLGAFFAARHFVADGGGGVPADAPVIDAREASDRVGQVARVCGTVVDAAHATSVRGSPTFLNFEEAYPDPVFTVVVWQDVRAQFDVPPESAFRGRRICVAGRIEEHEGRPQIVLDDPSRITEPPGGGPGEGDR